MYVLMQSLFHGFETQMPTDLSTAPGDNRTVTFRRFILMKAQLPLFEALGSFWIAVILYSAAPRAFYTRRTSGAAGSMSDRFTGPMPQMAIIAGSEWPRMTPS